MDVTTGAQVWNSYVAPNLDKASDVIEAAKNSIVNAHNTSVVKDVVPTKYQEQVQNTFSGWINEKTTSKDLTVYQYTSGNSLNRSPWYTTVGNYTPDQARQYLALPDKNSAVNVTKYTIPAGTTYLEGRVGSMVGEEDFGDYAKGGGTQIYLPDPYKAKCGSN